LKLCVTATLDVVVVVWSIFPDIRIIIRFIIPNSRDQVIRSIVTEYWRNVIPKCYRCIIRLPSRRRTKCTFIHCELIAIFLIRVIWNGGDLHGGILDRCKLIQMKYSGSRCYYWRVSIIELSKYLILHRLAEFLQVNFIFNKEFPWNNLLQWRCRYIRRNLTRIIIVLQVILRLRWKRHLRDLRFWYNWTILLWRCYLVC